LWGWPVIGRSKKNTGVPVDGSYSSALAKYTQEPFTHVPCPPATNTLPFGSSVAVSYGRVLRVLPVTVHVPAEGL